MIPTIAEPSIRKSDPKEELISAAEALLRSGGISAATVRAVSAKAGMNVSAINYHFSSRDALLVEICVRRLASHNAHMSQRLAQPDAKTRKIDDVMRILTDAAFDGWQQDDLLMMIGRESFGSPQMSQKFVPAVRQIFRLILPSLTEALPGMAPQDIEWRFILSFRTLLAETLSPESTSYFLNAPIGREQMIAYLSAAFMCADS